MLPLAVIVPGFVFVRCAGAERPRALAIEDYYRVKTIGSPEVSPDGRWVAYTVATHIEATNGNASEVWLAAFDGSAPPRRVGAASDDATAPAWLDDGRLRFISNGRTLSIDPSAPDLVIEGAPSGLSTGSLPRGGRAGGGRQAGTSLRTADGQWTAVVRDTPPPKRERVYESEFAKRHEERFKGVEFDWMDFQRDAAPFPLPNHADPDVNPPQEIFVTPAGGVERQLTHLGLRPAGANWNRAGTTLVFTADSAYRNEMVYGRSDIWSVTTDGAVRKLTSNAEYSYANARYSPDGRLDSRGSIDPNRRRDREKDEQWRPGRPRAPPGERRAGR